MPTREFEIVIGLDELPGAALPGERLSEDPSTLKVLSRKGGLSTEQLVNARMLRRSIDARHGRVKVRLLIDLQPTLQTHEATGPLLRMASTAAGEANHAPRVIIVGDGPAGLFCAYELARRGIAATVLDRGKPVQPRRHDLKAVNQRGTVDEDSNYCFGEGGAGTYSDGKLYTRSHRRDAVRDVLEVLAHHGAPGDILVDARPHIGSNRLPKVITSMREALEALGVVFRFGARVVDLQTEGTQVKGVVLADGSSHEADCVVLATGHSARDVFEMLHRGGWKMERKPFALGVRAEHAQEIVNEAQYGRFARDKRLPNASYRLAQTVDERGVYSFCMCPGGFIVPAATESNGVVVNGMSLSRRDSPFANSGMVIAIELADLDKAGFTGPLGGVDYQRALEQAAFAAGGGGFTAPAVRINDFVAGRTSVDLPKSSYQPGLQPADLAKVLDAGGIPLAAKLRTALTVFGRQLRGYIGSEAVLVGVESRTSSPVRIPRHAESLEHVELQGLYPAAEGAGYAGGIVSAAVDGMQIAHRIVERAVRL